MKTPSHFRRVFALPLVLSLLSACGGGGGGTQPPSPGPADAPAGLSTPSETLPDENLAEEGLSSFYGRFVPAEYASVESLRLSLLGMPDDLGVERIKVVEGKDLVEDLRVVDGEIRFITAADRGKTETIRMVIEGKTIKRPLDIELGSARFLEIAETTEFYDDAPDKAPVALKVQGLGPGNSIGHAGLVFEVDRDVEIDTLASNALLDVAGDGTLSLQDLWQPLPSKRGFSLSHEAVRDLIERLPDGDIGVDFTVNGDGKDNSFSRSWAFVMHVPVASMEGRLVDSRTQEVVRDFAGRKVAIRGTRSNGTRAVTMIDAEGRFSLDGLSAGVYVAELLDTRVPGFVQTVFEVKRGEKNVQVTLPFSPRAYRALTSEDNPATKARPVSRSTEKQANTTKAENVVDGVITGSEGCYKLAQSAGGYGFGLAITPRNPAAAHSCTATVTIPEGTQSVRLLGVVFSYIWSNPISLDQNSRDEQWSYRIAGLPKPITNNGSSDAGHVRGGTYFREGCIDVSKLTRNGPYDFSIHLMTSGTGNRDAVSLQVSARENCEPKLKVLEADFLVVNARGHRVMTPKRHTPEGLPNYPGAYISLSGKGEPKSWGIPLKVRYEPRNADIKEVKLVMTHGDGEKEADVKGQATFDGKGEIRFKDLVLPESFALSPFSDPVSFAIVIRGEVDGVDYTSDPFPVKIAKTEESSFTPLFHAGGLFGADRRYGQGVIEEGGDAWSADNALKWLQRNRYRFNDISAQHVAQHKSSGRSVLAHTGHSDGMQLDLRYADGAGGFSERMGGASNGDYIKKLFNDAEVDAYQKNLRSSTNISLAARWVIDNRKLIEREATGARVIYAGDEWMKSALLHGKFSSGNRVPYDGEGAVDGFLPVWNSKPKNVNFKPQHLHHWHISLKR